MEEKYVNLINSYKEYLDKELGYTEKTIEGYEVDLKQYTTFLCHQKIKLETINKDEAMLYLKYLDSLNLTNKSIARKMSSVRGFYNFLLDIKYVDNNIFNSMSNPKIEKKLPEFLNYEEITKLLDSVDTKPHWVFEIDCY